MRHVWALLVMVAACGDSVHPAIDAAGSDSANPDAPITPDLSASPTNVDLGSTTTGAMQTVMISNVSSHDVIITDVSIAGPGFAIKSNDCPPIHLMAVGTQCTIVVATTTFGAQTTNLHVGTTNGVLDVPLAALVSGTITTHVVGTGTGTITSDPPGIDCGTTCSATFSGSVTLTATPDSSSDFFLWSPDCGQSTTCTLSAPAEVYAQMVPKGTLTTVTIDTSGNGPADAVVVADFGEVTCAAPPCTISMPDNGFTRIGASSPVGFGGIAGACTTAPSILNGPSGVCTFTLNGPATITLTATRAPHELVSLVGFGGPLDFTTQSELLVSADKLYRVNDDSTLAVVGPSAGEHFRIGPDDHVVQWVGTTLAKRAIDGIVDWAIDVGAAPPDGCWKSGCDPFQVVHPIAIAPDGSVVIASGSMMRVYDPDGTHRFDATLTDIPLFTVGIDADGNFCSANLVVGGYESLFCFDPTGAPIAPIHIGDDKDTFAFDVEPSGLAGIQSEGFGVNMGGANAGFLDTTILQPSGDFPVAAAISATAVGFAYGNSQSFPAGVSIQHFVPDGTGQWGVVRKGLFEQGFVTGIIGNDLRDMRIAPNGRLAVFARYGSFGYDRGSFVPILQLYTP